MIMTETRVSLIKALYAVGKRVVCLRMEDPWSPVPSGTKGTVRAVDDIGTIHVNWDNGSSLGLIYGEDEFALVKE